MHLGVDAHGRGEGGPPEHRRPESEARGSGEGSRQNVAVLVTFWPSVPAACAHRAPDPPHAINKMGPSSIAAGTTVISFTPSGNLACCLVHTNCSGIVGTMMVH